MLDPSDCAVLITAAGRSSRMGRVKALLPWGSRLLIEHQLAVAADFGRVVVVLGAHAEAIRHRAQLDGEADKPHVVVVENSRWAEGRSTSIEAGMALISDRFEAVLVTAVDQPLSRLVVDALLDAWDARCAGCVPSFRERRGHPILLARRLFPALRAASEAAEGLRTIVRAQREAIATVEVDDPLVMADLNTPEGYEAALARLTTAEPA